EPLTNSAPHDQQYERPVDYTTVIMSLLLTDGPVTYEAKGYRIDRLKMTPPLSPEHAPGVFVSGSSESGVAAAKALGATAVKYPKPSGEEAALPAGGEWGLRIGVIARPR